jgi:iron complex outermembrane receptor protein
MAGVVLVLLWILASMPAEAGEPRHQFDIQRQPLDAALVEFSRQSGYRVARLTNPDAPLILVGPVRGSLEAGEALGLLLDGTEYTFSFVGKNMIAIRKRDTGADQPERPDAGTAPSQSLPRDAPRSAEPPAAQVPAQMNEVVVTARKRQESLRAIPLSVSAFSADDILNADLRDLEGVSLLTPGFRFDNMGHQEPGRYNTRLKFRGLTTSQFSPSFATGALFIDGIYVLNGGMSLSLLDVERIEVIKGPQAAYFGRNTFGGAVNLVTRDPNRDEFAATARLRTTDRANNEITALVEGPLVPGVLSASLSVRHYDKSGHFTATNGDRTGNEKTVSYNSVVSWRPADNLSFKLRYAHSMDDDGPPSQAFLSGKAFDTCTGRSIQTPQGTIYPRDYICGRVPYTRGTPGRPGSGEISSNTRLPAGFPILGHPFDLDELLTDPNSNPLSRVPNIDRVGLIRKTERVSLFARTMLDNEHSIDFAYGRNEQRANWIRDFDMTDRLGWFSRDPQYMKDESYEVRLTSPSDQRLRWMIGYNYYEQEFFSAGGGGDVVLSCYATQQEPPSNNYPEDCVGGVPGVRNVWMRNRLNNSDHAAVQGIFSSIDFDITRSLTASLEGRWQSDEFTKGGGLVDPGEPVLSKSFNDFLPRVILRWQPSSATNLWLSASTGQIPGDFNTDFINADARERAQYLQQDPRISEVLDAETLDAWELGWKQLFRDGRGQLNVALYHYTWKNIKGRSSFSINETCRAADVGVLAECDPANGLREGSPKQLPGLDGTLVPLFNQRPTLLPGYATIKGVELEGRFELNDRLSGYIAASYIDSKYDDYSFNRIEQPGYTQMAGNSTPRQPKWSGVASLTWNMNLFAEPAYLRGDIFYTGRNYVDEANLAYIDDYFLVNVRIGMDLSSSWSLEFFSTNLFDKKAWQVGARWSDFSLPSQLPTVTAFNGVAVTPLDRREFGLRVNYVR